MGNNVDSPDQTTIKGSNEKKLKTFLVNMCNRSAFSANNFSRRLRALACFCSWCFLHSVADLINTRHASSSYASIKCTYTLNNNKLKQHKTGQRILTKGHIADLSPLLAAHRFVRPWPLEPVPKRHLNQFSHFCVHHINESMMGQATIAPSTWGIWTPSNTWFLALT